MAKRATNLRLDEDKLKRIDELAGPRGRTAWIERAIDNELFRMAEIPDAVAAAIAISGAQAKRKRRTSTPETRQVQPRFKKS